MQWGEPCPQPSPSVPLLENSRYAPLEILGRGSFGFVVKSLDRMTDEVVAIKMLRRTDMSKYVEAEIQNHSKLMHPHVIQFIRVFLTNENICIVMEYASGGSLFQYVKSQHRLREAVARWFFQQLIIGVDYCHKRGVANRDLKLENMLLQEVDNLPLPLLKICDFGYSKADYSAAKSKVGTLTYMAPEVLHNREYDGKKADIWSCGVMLYVMLFGKYPFGAELCQTDNLVDVVRMLEKMVNRQFEMPNDVQISWECQQLLYQLLDPSPSRISLEEVMQQRWFLTNLPTKAATMNDRYLNEPTEGAQTAEEIERVLSQAQLITRQSYQHMPGYIMQGDGYTS